MKFWISIFVVTVVYSLGFCDASKHILGEYLDYTMHKSYQRTLIDDVNTVRKDYTIIYKYHGAEYKKVAYLEIDVNVESTGQVHATDRKKFIEATIHIKNALNVNATIRIYGYGPTPIPTIGWLRKDFDTKSLTFIYKKNSGPPIAKPFAQNAIGRRRKNVSLIHFESRNVTNRSRFPSRAFQYSGDEYITYVGFSFNSPTAMVLINTSFVGEEEFNAIAYDMNTEHFVANMSVYGINGRNGRPPKFEGVI